MTSHTLSFKTKIADMNSFSLQNFIRRFEIPQKSTSHKFGWAFFSFKNKSMCKFPNNWDYCHHTKIASFQISYRLYWVRSFNIFISCAWLFQTFDKATDLFKYNVYLMKTRHKNFMCTTFYAHTFLSNKIFQSRKTFDLYKGAHHIISLFVTR